MSSCSRFRILFCLVLVCLLASLYAVASDESRFPDEEKTKTNPINDQETVKSSTSEESGSSSSSTDNTTESTTTPPKRAKIRVDPNFDVKNEDWGTYYDPQNIFCGKYDCYKILGFDYESYDTIKPTTKEITQRYRQLGREWHPDKSKHKQAKERFVKIARAYEVLTDFDTRKEYDMLRYDQKAYFNKYGANVMWAYAPKTDLTIVVLIVLVIANVISWFSQKHRWQLVADRLIKAAVEDWAPRDGGTEESKHLREEALAILEQRQKENHENDPDGPSTLELLTSNGTSTTSNGTAAPKGSVNRKKAPTKEKTNAKVKLSIKEKKKLENDAILPIITELVNAMDDFGSGFHKPTWKDLVIVSMMKMPYSVGLTLFWQIKYTVRRLQNLELNDEEKEVLTSNAVGPVRWNTSTDEDKEQMIKKQLWKSENLVKFNEEQEFKKLSKAEQKMYLTLKKRGQLDKFDSRPGGPEGIPDIKME